MIKLNNKTKYILIATFAVIIIAIAIVIATMGVKAISPVEKMVQPDPIATNNTKHEEYPFGATINYPTVTREGYTFKGWKVKGTDAVFNPLTMPSNNIQVYAVWEINKYTVKFKYKIGNGAEVYDTKLVPDRIVEHGSVLTNIPNVGTFLRDLSAGIELTSWNINIAAPVVADTIFVAQLDYINYSITFKNYDGSIIETQTKHFDDVLTAPTVARVGYTFNGWSPALVTVSKNAEYTAQWLINLYTVQFKYKLPGSTELLSSTYAPNQSIAYGSVAAIPSIGSLLRDGAYGLEIENWSPVETTVITGDTTFVATLKYINYTLTFKENDIVLKTEIKHYGDIVNSPAQSKIGYTFNGWSTTKDGTTILTELPTMSNENITYYARFSINSYIVTFVDPIGGPDIARQTVVYNTAPTMPLSPIKIGYTFKGWSATDGGAILATLPLQPENDVTYYAIFEVNNYTIDWDGNGGSFAK